jgi:hypothetical protein
LCLDCRHVPVLKMSAFSWRWRMAATCMWTDRRLRSYSCVASQANWSQSHGFQRMIHNADFNTTKVTCVHSLMTVGEKFTYFFGFFTNYYQSTVFTGKSRWWILAAMAIYAPFVSHTNIVPGPVSDPDVRIEVSYEICIHA